MTDTKKPHTTVAQDVAAFRAVLDGQHAQTETPAGVLADITIKPTITREEEDRCDQELEDLPPDHSVWDEARAALTAALQEGKSHG